MRVVDLDGVMFVPVVDETHGGAVVEMKMTVAEFFEKCCGGFAPEVVEAIPVEWLEKMRKETALARTADSIGNVLVLWRREEKREDRYYGDENL